MNPFRYRGYYYDNETGWYYLNSRYYDPETCRFINADSQLAYTLLLGNNLYAYSGNNPISNVDAEGTMWQFNPAMHPCAMTYSSAEKIPVGMRGPGQYDSTAYDSYRIRSINAAADAALGGYYFAGLSSAVMNPGGYIVSGAVSVTDDMALSTGQVKMRHVRAKGNEGERISGIDKNHERIDSLTGTASYRIPDGLNHDLKTLSEVKYYSRVLSYTNQLRDFVMWAELKGYTIHLYTNAKPSAPLQSVVDSGVIKVFPLGKG